MELSPDGYLLKPVNYSTLKMRLPQFCKKKIALSSALIAFQSGDYSDVIRVVDTLTSQDKDIVSHGQLIKAKALLALKDYPSAIEVLRNLHLGPDKNLAIIERAKLAQEQKDYSLAQQLLRTISHDKLLSPQIDEEYADILAEQNQYQEASVELKKAIDASPKSIPRLSKHVAYCLANTDYDNALTTTKQLVQQSRYSFRESIQALFLGASIQLDIANNQYGSEREASVAQISQWVTLWRNQFPRGDYKAFELLLFARASFLQQHSDKAQRLFKEFIDEKLVPSELPISTEIRIELAKVAYLLKADDLYHDTIYSLNEDLSFAASPQSKAIMCYLAKIRIELEHKGTHVREIKSRAGRYIENRQYERAIALLTRPLLDNIADAEIHMLILHALTYCWPSNWRRREVVKLVMKCKSRLRSSQLSDTIEYQEYCSLLAKQLQATIIAEDAHVDSELLTSGVHA